MIIVTTHTNTDFDGLASMVAASYLYPEAVRVAPAHVQPSVRDFLAVHWDMLQLRSRNALNVSEVERLIVTDTSNWERLDALDELARRDNFPAIIWDHHMTPGNIEAEEEHREEVGATVTLLLERMKARDCAFSPVQATLFLLGIYDDTGSLSFPNTTSRDAGMAAFLLENGADLNVVSAYLDSALDARHLDIFSRMLSESETFAIGSLQLGVCVQDTHKGLNMLPTVVSKFKEIKGLDVAFGIFPMSARKTVVIGRGNPKMFDVGTLARVLGGGGHPGAGSAVVHAPTDAVRERVIELIRQAPGREIPVRNLMTKTSECIPAGVTIREAAARLAHAGRQAMLVVEDNHRLLGSFAKEQTAKIKQDRQWDRPVTSMIRQNLPVIHPDQSVREALQLMAHSELGFLPVVADGRLIGEITRSAIILNMYDF
ncbi:nanoRNase/pAp phosphatase, hydrolyzes c-di-AMP and oligoRNAs [Desulfonatronum thiosulfatophilum]|uniref:NanoRNase/pAp phosphatase, hydrolyzes c-di-AMP and oligoRNAs n=1 Tax=Desulfonatronum thiosulfatophilum TaxID=617002 RepID=A0A1G6AAG2_9BACT|nr:CBS domain-containing protein [Desulfonatronum thiosulfatophilum]SDB05286.1 nanoRNase/pAp phosphatase, hydrolyzes c-di-AMP and oligoRNAs [Desulfonatronum thiosulfatophilum]